MCWCAEAVVINLLRRTGLLIGGITRDGTKKLPSDDMLHVQIQALGPVPERTVLWMPSLSLHYNTHPRLSALQGTTSLASPSAVCVALITPRILLLVICSLWSYAPSRNMVSVIETQTIPQNKSVEFPPTPPETIVDCEDGKFVQSIGDGKEELDIPLPPPSTAPTEILKVDKPTPDSHVPRDSRLIRLTGVHPFNCEAPLTDLFKEGFLTTPELFYVRNHGPVPEVRDEDIPDWEFSVEGYVTQHQGQRSAESPTLLQSRCQPIENHPQRVIVRL